MSEAMNTPKLPPLPEWFESASEHLKNDVRNYALAAIEAQGVPEIDYEALIAAAHKRDRKWAQGTNGCIAFKYGAEWFRDQLLASAPQAPQAAVVQQEPLSREEREVVMSSIRDSCDLIHAGVMQQEPVANIWESFPAYLIDNHEGETISEEGLQHALAEMLADQKYTHPAQQAKPQPLSDKEADRMTERFYLNGRPVPALYRLSLVRATERHYGIKE